MSDIYKLQYNGMTLAYPDWNGYVSFEYVPVQLVQFGAYANSTATLAITATKDEQTTAWNNNGGTAFKDIPLGSEITVTADVPTYWRVGAGAPSGVSGWTTAAFSRGFSAHGYVTADGYATTTNTHKNTFTARGTYFSPSITQSHGSQTGNWSTVYGVLTSASQNVSTYLTSVTSTVYTYLYSTNYTNTAKSTSGWNPGANSNISAYGFTGAPSGLVRPWSQNTLNMNKRIGSTNIATQAFTAKTGTYNFAATQYTSTTKGIPNWQIKYGSKNQDQLALGGSWTATGYLP